MKLLIIAPIVFALTGCSGTMQGVVRTTGQPVQFAYEQGFDSDTLTAVIDGETYKGKAVLHGADYIGNAWTADMTMATLFGTSSNGVASAVLIGDKGHSIKCQLQYADKSGMTSSGGVGECKMSDGRILDVVW